MAVVGGGLCSDCGWIRDKDYSLLRSAQMCFHGKHICRQCCNYMFVSNSFMSGCIASLMIYVPCEGAYFWNIHSTDLSNKHHKVASCCEVKAKVQTASLCTFAIDTVQLQVPVGSMLGYEQESYLNNIVNRQFKR